MKVTLILLISVIAALGYVEHIHVSDEVLITKNGQNSNRAKKTKNYSILQITYLGPWSDE